MRKSTLWFGLLWLGLFGGLALAVKTNAAWVASLDATLAKLMVTANTPLNSALLQSIANLASPAVSLALAALLTLWLWHQRGIRAAAWLGAIEFGGAATAEAAKFLVARVRPTHQLIPDTGYSFPSGHVFCTMLLVLAVLTLALPAIQDPEGRLVAVLVAIIWIGLVAMSRVYFRDHFATDVLGSALFAAGWWQVATSLQAHFTVQSERKSVA